jgi:hypothetical protein
MRQTISGLIAAVAVMTAGVAPAMACGGGLFQSSCSPCGQAYVEPCAQSYVAAPVYSGCNTGCGTASYERLSDPDEQHYPEQQYYYVNQGPTYSGPGNFAPYPTYQEGGYHHRPYHYGYATNHYYGGAGVEGYGYPTHRHWGSHSYRYGYVHRSYAPRYSQYYGLHPHHFGYREHVLRRYY